MTPGAPETVLIVDDDPDIRTFLEISLSLHGYEVVQASDGAEALELALAHRPALVLMDVMMPNVDGLEALRRMRADSRLSDTPVILVTAKAQGADKVAGLADGADDYITKPFDPEELVARVGSTLRRSSEMRTVSPLTGLPGNSRIEAELALRVEAGDAFALMYADLNQFKAYNDYYGFMAGDEVLKGLGAVIAAAVEDLDVDDAFVGHVGGDDFVVVVPIARAEDVAREVCERFDAVVPGYYRAEDLAAGHIEITDRQGHVVRVGPVSVSIGIARNDERRWTHPSQPVEVATEMKSYAKRASDGGSNWAFDRRRTEDAGEDPTDVDRGDADRVDEDPDGPRHAAADGAVAVQDASEPPPPS